MKSPLFWIAIGALVGILGGAASIVIRELRSLNKEQRRCRLFGHTKPVYHISRAYWWCGRCNRTLGMNPDLWTPEAMAEHAEMMRRPDRN